MTVVPSVTSVKKQNPGFGWPGSALGALNNNLNANSADKYELNINKVQPVNLLLTQVNKLSGLKFRGVVVQWGEPRYHMRAVPNIPPIKPAMILVMMVALIIN